VFNVDAEGNSIATDLDIYREVGADTALVQQTTVPAADGTVTVRFHGVDKDNAKVSAVRVERLGPVEERPVKMTAVQPDPERRSDSAIEFVRVTVPEPTETTNWTISDDDGSGQVTTFPSEQLSGDYYFARNPEVFAETWHLDRSRVFELETLLNNGGETLRLRNGDGAVVDEFAYEGATTSDGWSVDVGTGEVAVRKSTDGSYTDTDSASDWRVREENAFHTLEAGPVPDAGVAYVDSTGNNYLESVDAQGRVAFYDVINPGTVGPIEKDLDNDGRLELPYIDGNGNIKIVDKTGGPTKFVDSSKVKTGTTRIGVGDLDGDGTPAVIFRGTSSRISKKEVGGSVRSIKYTDGNSNVDLKGHAVAGVADFDSKGSPELVYVESTDNSELATFDPDEKNGKGKQRVLNEKPGSPNAIGSPGDYDGDGEQEVPYVTQSDELALIDNGKKVTVLTGSGTPKPTTSPMGRLDVTGDANPEVIFRGANNQIYYATADGSVEPLLDRYGRELPTKSGPGVT
jgi:hypothetical protein